MTEKKINFPSYSNSFALIYFANKKNPSIKFIKKSLIIVRYNNKNQKVFHESKKMQAKCAHMAAYMLCNVPTIKRWIDN